MTKIGFILELRDRLSSLPKKELEERLNFYSEMIEDRMEDGLSEEEAVSEIGSIEEIASQIAGDIPLTKIVKEQIRPKRKMRAWEIVLIVLGFPLWFSLLAATFAVALSIYVSVLSVIVSFWSVFVLLAAVSLAGIVMSVVSFIDGFALNGLVFLSVSFICAGLSIFTFLGCMYTTKGVMKFGKLTVRWLKGCFVRKADEQQ